MDSPPLIRHILFDLDGTLTDPFPGISACILHALEQLQVPAPVPGDLRNWIGPPLRQSFERHLARSGGGDADHALALYRDRFSTVGLFENAVYPDIPKLLDFISGFGVRMVLATSKPKVYASRIVDHFHIDQWLHAVFGSELDGLRSDKTDLLTHITDELSLVPRECLMIGDREHDMLAAARLGMNSIGVLWGYGTAVELIEAGAETLVASPDELIDLLEVQFHQD
jgi:phosphoglycolate phosphatase